MSKIISCLQSSFTPIPFNLILNCRDYSYLINRVTKKPVVFYDGSVNVR